MAKAKHDDRTLIDYAKTLLERGRPIPPSLAHVMDEAQREFAAEENRRKHPRAAAMVDAARELFGGDVKVIRMFGPTE